MHDQLYRFGLLLLLRLGLPQENPSVEHSFTGKLRPGRGSCPDVDNGKHTTTAQQGRSRCKTRLYGMHLAQTALRKIFQNSDSDIVTYTILLSGVWGPESGGSQKTLGAGSPPPLPPTKAGVVAPRLAGPPQGNPSRGGERSGGTVRSAAGTKVVGFQISQGSTLAHPEVPPVPTPTCVVPCQNCHWTMYSKVR